MLNLEINPYQQMVDSRKEWERRHGKNARRLLRKSTQKNRVNPYRYFNGERIVQFYCQYELYQFAGSSINRKLDAERKKDETINVETLEENADATELCTTEEGRAGGVGDVAGSDDRKKHRVHVLSPRSKQKIREKTGAFFRARGKNSTFVTLSFIERVTDRLAIDLLNKFFVQLRKQYGNFEYIWVIERQKDNEKFKDNPHFHIVIDRRLSIVRCNSLWVLQQYNEGLRGYSKKLERVLHPEEVEMMHNETMKLLRAYRKEKDLAKRNVIEGKINGIKIGRFLNPFDIKKVRTIDGLSCYLTKYVSKNNDEFNCSTWRCSRGVSRLYTKFAASYDLWNEAGSPEVNFYVNEETGEYKAAKAIEIQMKVKNKQTGKMEVKNGYPVATMIYILNKKHFSQYMAIVDRLNKWVLDGFEPDFKRLSYDEYVSRCHNFQMCN